MPSFDKATNHRNYTSRPLWANYQNSTRILIVIIFFSILSFTVHYFAFSNNRNFYEFFMIINI